MAFLLTFLAPAFFPLFSILVSDVTRGEEVGDVLRATSWDTWPGVGWRPLAEPQRVGHAPPQRCGPCGQQARGVSSREPTVFESRLGEKLTCVTSPKVTRPQENDTLPLVSQNLCLWGEFMVRQ
ncbi:hypothetical protein BHM03_00019937 [Ensete ventricosum]|nr:hypothetical protein BHM03_00019937 [Ensete ventricosum]